MKLAVILDYFTATVWIYSGFIFTHQHLKIRLFPPYSHRRQILKETNTHEYIKHHNTSKRASIYNTVYSFFCIICRYVYIMWVYVTIYIYIYSLYLLYKVGTVIIQVNLVSCSGFYYLTVWKTKQHLFVFKICSCRKCAFIHLTKQTSWDTNRPTSISI